MPLQSDIQIDVSKFDPSNITQKTKDINEQLIKAQTSGGPVWYKVRQQHKQSFLL